MIESRLSDSHQGTIPSGISLHMHTDKNNLDLQAANYSISNPSRESSLNIQTTRFGNLSRERSLASNSKSKGKNELLTTSRVLTSLLLSGPALLSLSFQRCRNRHFNFFFCTASPNR